MEINLPPLPPVIYAYCEGREALPEAVRAYAREAAEAERAEWEAERKNAIRSLRELCADHGDNDWPDDLDLSDIIDKHLMPYLEAAAIRGQQEPK